MVLEHMDYLELDLEEHNILLMDFQLNLYYRNKLDDVFQLYSKHQHRMILGMDLYI